MVLLVKSTASTDWPLLPLAFSSGENLSASILLSNYGPGNVTADSVKWQVVVNGSALCSGAGDAGVTLAQGEVATAVLATCVLPKLGNYPTAAHTQSQVPQRVELRSWVVDISDEKTILTNNSWLSRL